MTNELSKSAREARNAYAREYRKQNREKVRQQNRLYWERRAMKQAAQEKAANDK